MVTDPIADMLNRVRNALRVHQDFTLVPASGLKLSLARIFKEEGFIAGYEVLRGKPQRMIKVYLKYLENGEPLIQGLKRVSKPGLRIYVKSQEIPRLYGGLGVAFLSTPKGVMTGREARKQRVGGEFLFYAW